MEAKQKDFSVEEFLELQDQFFELQRSLILLNYNINYYCLLTLLQFLYYYYYYYYYYYCYYYYYYRKAFEIAFRFEDNEKQKLKGQPSLDVEDTGKQWKNDKLE